MVMRIDLRLSSISESFLKNIQGAATDKNHDQELVRKIWHSYELYDHPKLEQRITDSERSDNGNNTSMTTCPRLERRSIIKLHQTMERKL